MPVFSTQKCWTTWIWTSTSSSPKTRILFQKKTFLLKDCRARHLKNGTLRTCVALLGAELWQIPSMVIFGGFCIYLLVMYAQSPPIITMHCICYSSPPLNITKERILLKIALKLWELIVNGFKFDFFKVNAIWTIESENAHLRNICWFKRL